MYSYVGAKLQRTQICITHQRSRIFGKLEHIPSEPVQRETPPYPRLSLFEWIVNATHDQEWIVTPTRVRWIILSSARSWLAWSTLLCVLRFWLPSWNQRIPRVNIFMPAATKHPRNTLDDAQVPALSTPSIEHVPRALSNVAMCIIEWGFVLAVQYCKSPDLFLCTVANMHF